MHKVLVNFIAQLIIKRMLFKPYREILKKASFANFALFFTFGFNNKHSCSSTYSGYREGNDQLCIVNNFKTFFMVKTVSLKHGMHTYMDFYTISRSMVHELHCMCIASQKGISVSFGWQTFGESHTKCTLHVAV